MKKIDPVILKETKYIATWIVILSMLMQSVFLIIGKWNYTVLLGNIYSAAFGTLNFLLMGLTVQKALEKEEKDAKKFIRFSQLYRNIMLLLIMVLGVFIPFFNTLAVLIPMFFAGIAVYIKPLVNKIMKK
ncbi:MAG: hypothetical protein E7607_02000 [Ruminococcaceae bacterium]|nr:hypothetical protein [Oscillospiraceae bacterium]